MGSRVFRKGRSSEGIRKTRTRGVDARKIGIRTRRRMGDARTGPRRRIRIETRRRKQRKTKTTRIRIRRRRTTRRMLKRRKRRRRSLDRAAGRRARTEEGEKTREGGQGPEATAARKEGEARIARARTRERGRLAIAASAIGVRAVRSVVRPALAGSAEAGAATSEAGVEGYYCSQCVGSGHVQCGGSEAIRVSASACFGGCAWSLRQSTCDAPFVEKKKKKKKKKSPGLLPLLKKKKKKK